MSIATSPNGSRAKIVTLTMNPALDITTSVDRVRPTDKLRCQGARHDPGGGGINVARIASVLGASVFPAGGPTGDVVADLLVEQGVPFHRVRISGRTRESFTVNEESRRRLSWFHSVIAERCWSRLMLLNVFRRSGCVLEVAWVPAMQWLQRLRLASAEGGRCRSPFASALPPEPRC